MGDNIVLRKFYKLLLYSFIPLFIGGLIYTGFRTKNLLMFKWFKYIKIDNLIETYRENFGNIKLPEFIIYSLPNGLWVFSFLTFIIITTHKKIRLAFILVCIFISTGFEIFQRIKIIPGTFCLIDFCTSIFFTILSFIVTKGEWYNENF